MVVSPPTVDASYVIGSGVETCKRWLSCHRQETATAEKDDKWPVILKQNNIVTLRLRSG